MKSIVQFISIGFALYALILVVFYFLQNKMLFFPGPAPFGKCPDMEQRGVAALSIKDIRYYLKTKPNPTEEEIESAMSGNICRCGTYVRIKAAIQQAAKSSTK